LEADRRDISDDGIIILQLLEDLLQQKNGRGGSGKKYKKADVDRIMHALVFEGVLQEISQENGSGFSSDYLQFGPKGDMLRNRQFQFFVDFPCGLSKAKSKNKSKDSLQRFIKSQAFKKQQEVKHQK